MCIRDSANGGFLIDPYYIDRIEDAQGNVVFQAEPKPICYDCEYTAYNLPEIVVDDVSEEGIVEVPDTSNQQVKNPPKLLQKVATRAPRIISAENSYIVQSMMREVIRRGTATKAQVLKRSDLAGKTGTTNDQRDAWFAGFVPELVTVSWIGFDDMQQLGRREYGAVAALPMWIDFMEVALKDIPVTNFENVVPPKGVVQAVINPESGNLIRLGSLEDNEQTIEINMQNIEEVLDRDVNGYDVYNYTGPTMEEWYVADTLPEIEQPGIEDVFFFEGETTIQTNAEGEEEVVVEDESLF